MVDIRSLLEQGYRHYQEGRLRHAEDLCRRVLRADPDNPDGFNLLAVIAGQQGRASEAIELMEKAARAAPENPQFSNNLGQLYRNRGRVDEAIQAYRAALNADPDFADAHNNLGNALTMAGRLEEAIGHYRRALEIDPNNARAHYNLATTLSKQGNPLAAIESFRTVVGIAPDYTDAYNNLGLVLHGLERPEEAIDSYRKALTLRPDYAEAHNNLGITLKDLGRANEALDCFHKALALKPDYAEAHNNLGKTLVELGRQEDGAAHYREAIAIKPDHVEAHHNLGLALLQQGNFGEGWAEYEWRLRSEEWARQRPFPQAPWAGEPVDGKTVLVWAEQGVGDEVMFAGMVPDLMDAGAHVVLEADPRLVPLFERSFDGVECVAKKVPPVAETERGGIDFQVPGGNLGRWLRSDRDSFPGRDSYLIADADWAATLKDRYRDGTGDRLIGIAWISKNRRSGTEKSMRLMELAPLTRIPGLRLIDLQYGDTAGERVQFKEETGASIVHDEKIDQMADLDAFAAQVAAMDLIVSVSNTTVHIAGALGVPAWVMLHTTPLSCWLLEGEDSPWYPSVRLFRQTEPGEWGDVIGRVGDALQAFAGGG